MPHWILLSALVFLNAAGFARSEIPAEADPFNYPIADRPGSSRSWVAGTLGAHSGYDFSMPCGTPVAALRRGTVVRAGWAGRGDPTGVFSLIRYEDGVHAMFAHLRKVLAGAGAQVSADTIIGLSGNTPNHACHLHLELHQGDAGWGTFESLVDASEYYARPEAGAYRCRWQSQSVSPTLAVGETAGMWVQLKNTGREAWVLGGPSEARLGVVGDSLEFADLGMAEGWALPNRPAAQYEERVEPGENGTFIFPVKGARPGVFRLALRPVIDGVTWMDDEGIFFDITVLRERLSP